MSTNSNLLGYNMISIRTLSLLAYLTYILTDIIIYSLGLLSPYKVIPWVLILVSP
jgi:hypothetical protein